MNIMRVLWLLPLLGAATTPAHALTLGVAVMEPRAVGVSAEQAQQAHTLFLTHVGQALTGTRFTLVPVEELRHILADMPGCKPGTCDIQVATRQGAVVLVSLEVARVKDEFSVAARLFETRQGAQLARALPVGPTWDAVTRQVPSVVTLLMDALKSSHAAAVAAMKAGEKRYILLPPGPAAQAVITRPPPPSAGRRVVEDGQSVGLENALRPVRTDFNTCYRTALANKPNAQGKLMLSVDVEPDGHVGRADIIQDNILHAGLQACVLGRVKSLQFAPQPYAWRMQFPLVFVPTR